MKKLASELAPLVLTVALLFVAREKPWTSWLLVPWLLLTWLSTVMLGWHYALDGPGGFGVAWASVIIARIIQLFWQRPAMRLMGKN